MCQNQANATVTDQSNTNTSDSDSIGTNATGIDYETENILALRWKLSQVGVSYEGLRFDVHYTVSDYIEKKLITYSIYDGPGCSATANFITHLNYFSAWVTEDDTPLGGGLGMRDLTLSTEINSTSITQSRVYQETNNEAQIEFCARLSLYNKDVSDPTAIEINHQETSIRLLVDLQDEFAIQSQAVEAKDKGVETASDSFFVEAFVCTEAGIPILDTVPFMQGELVRVCVQPTAQAVDIGFRMRSIDRFTFWQGYLSQEAIINQKVSINGLTELWCDQGSNLCMFETLLMASFFQGPNTVDGTGFAALQFGSGTTARRRLRSNASIGQTRRVLKGGQKALQLDQFRIEKVERHSSNATSCRRFTWAVLICLVVTIQIIQRHS